MLKFVNDHELAVRMGRQARDRVVQKFSTKTFGDLLNSYVLNVYHQRIE
jgi:alpha-1,3/alpha-1,6-mannosyltransferase